MNIGITLYICKTKCWNCSEEYNATYMKWAVDDERAFVSPNSFNEKQKNIAKENGVIIKELAYEYADGRVDVHTANICPHCGKPFGNNHIKELIGSEIKEIIIRTKTE